MDRQNLQNLRRLAPDDDARAKIHLLRAFEGTEGEQTAGAGSDEVPDPYYGGPDGFDEVIDICDRACRGLLAHLRKAHGLP
jgi:protein-tyrosine phosphatase